MTSTRKIIVGIATVLSLGMAAAVHAQTPGSGPGMGPMGVPGARGPGGNFDPAAMLDARMTYLKSALKITAAQEPAWNDYTAAVKAQLDAMKAARTAAAQSATLPAPQRMLQHLDLMQQHLVSMRSFVTQDVQKLYSALTPEQQAVADKLLGKPHRGFGRHGA
ncbi:MAG: Spy/CpxP family protein refolding chaperone [Proteobacteria bacterium]|nr:Spy/CpxP family protein refolding chaperone [Pseudomonadota bacterium]